MLSHYIVHHGSSLGRSDFHWHAMKDNIKSLVEDNQGFLFPSPQNIKIGQVLIKGLVLTPTL
jgi:hypothetical protein